MPSSTVLTGVTRQIPKLMVRVRFPSPALATKAPAAVIEGLTHRDQGHPVQGHACDSGIRCCIGGSTGGQLRLLQTCAAGLNAYAGLGSRLPACARMLSIASQSAGQRVARA